MALGILALWATTPKIDHIEFTGDRKGVLLHFAVEEDFKDFNCDLEYTTNLAPNGLPTGPWQNLRSFPSQGVIQHYVWPDFFNTNTRARFYRLRFYP